MRRLGLMVAGFALLLGGCGPFASPRPPAVDISGHWTGRWVGYGIANIPREDAAFADFSQNGYRGRGRLTLDGTGAADSVPVAIRATGAEGSRVLFEISGANVHVTHENGPAYLVAEFRVTGDRMIGHIPDADPPVRIVLERAKPEAPKPPPPPAAAAPPLPPPPPPVAPAPEPAAPTPPPVAAEPAPPTTPTPEPATPPSGEQLAQQQPPPQPSTPAEPRPAPRDFVVVPQLATVYFAFDKADVRPEEATKLDQNAEWLKGNEVLVLIEGHADERGTNEYNLALGDRRAKAIRDYLIGKGIATERINTVSYGEERPVCTEKTEDCYKRNRRGDFLAKPK
jgi:peptidoglycan-associated lipoprotein